MEARMPTYRIYAARYWVISLLMFAGCALVSTTPQQAYTLESFRHCERSAGVSMPILLDHVKPDGRYSYKYWGSNDQRLFSDCMTQYRREHPYLDWAKAQGNARPGTLAAAPSPGAGSEMPSTGSLPIWRVGDEWQYAYKSPSDSGTYVWSVDRVDTLDGAQHYVIRTGTREIFYRVSDFASSIERVDGAIVSRHTPSRMNFAWPLTVGKTWEQSYREERPVDRSTTNRDSIWKVEGEETVTVLAGTFRTLKVTHRNKNTGAIIYEMWVAPEVKQWVKIREVLSAGGIRERELISFKLAKP
jgi:hypothetical protein